MRERERDVIKLSGECWWRSDMIVSKGGGCESFRGNVWKNSETKIWTKMEEKINLFKK